MSCEYVLNNVTSQPWRLFQVIHRVKNIFRRYYQTVYSEKKLRQLLRQCAGESSDAGQAEQMFYLLPTTKVLNQ